MVIRSWVQGTHGAEQALHARLKDSRIRLEWFEDNHDVEGLIDEIRDEALDRGILWSLENDPDNDDFLEAGRDSVLFTEEDILGIIAEYDRFLERMDAAGAVYT